MSEHAQELKEFLSKSIQRIEDTRIKIFADRATWIGNDELHYTRRYEELDIEQMKVFINAMVQLLDLEETFKIASQLEKRR